MCPYLFQNYHYRINLLCFYAEYLQVSPKGYPPRVKNRRKPKSRREYRLSGSSLSLKKPFTFIAKQIYFLTGNRYIISVYRFHQVILWLKPNTPLFFKESFYDCPLRYQLEPLQYPHYWHYSAAGQASSLHREFRHWSTNNKTRPTKVISTHPNRPVLFPFNYNLKNTLMSCLHLVQPLQFFLFHAKRVFRTRERTFLHFFIKSIQRVYHLLI